MYLTKVHLFWTAASIKNLLILQTLCAKFYAHPSRVLLTPFPDNPKFDTDHWFNLQSNFLIDPFQSKQCFIQTDCIFYSSYCAKFQLYTFQSLQKTIIGTNHYYNNGENRKQYCNQKYLEYNKPWKYCECNCFCVKCCKNILKYKIFYNNECFAISLHIQRIFILDAICFA